VSRETERPPRTANPAVIQGLRQTGDPDAKNFGQTARKYGLFLAGIAAVVAGLVGWRRWQQRKAEWELNDPMALVLELSVAHQLSEREKRLMLDISVQRALSSPLELFVEPKFLLEALDNGAVGMSRSMVRQLLSKLFDITVEGNQASGVLDAADVETVYYARGSQP